MAGQLTWYVSEPILEEYRAVLGRPKFKSMEFLRIKAVLNALQRATVLSPTTTVSASSDEADNGFLECAAAARAGYLITGNTRHFPSKWEGTLIVTPREFLKLIEDV